MWCATQARDFKGPSFQIGRRSKERRLRNFRYIRVWRDSECGSKHITRKLQVPARNFQNDYNVTASGGVSSLKEFVLFLKEQSLKS